MPLPVSGLWLTARAELEQEVSGWATGPGQAIDEGPQIRSQVPLDDPTPRRFRPLLTPDTRAARCAPAADAPPLSTQWQLHPWAQAASTLDMPEPVGC